MKSATDGTNFNVTFWGTRGSISTPGSSTEKYGGNTPCISIKHKDTELIFDAGTGIRNLGLHLAHSVATTGRPLNLHLFLSHTHWDHIQGLPFFAPAYISGTNLSIYGSPKKERLLEGILKGQMDENYFPVNMDALAAKISVIEMPSTLMRTGSVTILWQEQIMHPGGSVRYKIMAGKKQIVYATDVELDKILGTKKNLSEHKHLVDQYSKFIHGADLLIADGQYTSEEYPQKTGFGHTSIPILLEIAAREKVKNLAIFHHDPQHSDMFIDRLWAYYAPRMLAGKHEMNIFWAREGMTISV